MLLISDVVDESTLIGLFSKQIMTAANTINAIIIAEALSVILYFIAMCMNYVKAFIESKGDAPKFFDAQELKRGIAVMIMIPIMPALVYTIFEIGDNLGVLYEIDGGDEASSMAKLFVRANSVSFSFLNFGYNMVMELIAIILLGLAAMIKSGVLMITGFLKGFLVIVSPIAMAFSILPFLKDQAIKLIKVALNVSFVLFTFNILDILFYTSLELYIDNVIGLENTSFFWFLGAMSFTLCVLYVMVMWLTSLYVGDPASAAVMTTAATMAAGAVMMMAKGAAALGTGGASAAAGGGNIGADLAKKIVESVTDTDKK